MEHLEGIDSVIVAAFVGGFAAYLYNQIFKVSEDNTEMISVGAAVGASVQIVLRFTGVS